MTLILVNHQFMSLKEAKKMFRKKFKHSKFTTKTKRTF